MIVPSLHRSTLRRLIRLLTYVTAISLFLDFFNTLSTYKTFNRNLVANTITRVDDLPSRAQNQRIFIVAQFWTSAEVIVNHWAAAIWNLTDTLGSENVYLSILESGSLDNTEEVLRWFEAGLEQRGVDRTITIDPTTHEDAVDEGPDNPDGTEKRGWIYTGDSKPPGEKELRRIPYLAGLRNRGLAPMLEIQRKKGITFDKILFVNDVIFKPSDVLSLLATNSGVYDVACAIDFHYPPDYYDTFVLRDSHGNPTATRHFPFFRSRTSRGPIKHGLPAPVKSCWNGMIVVDAAPYYDLHTPVEAYNLDGLPIKTRKGLRFRGIPDTLATAHLEGSECCLIHADLIDRGQAKKGIYMNPAVRVGYTETVGLKKTSYDLVHRGPGGIGYVTLKEYFIGIWKNRWMRWTRTPWFDSRKVWRRIQRWQADGKSLGEVREEVGAFCTVDEMQILIWNGWKHVW